MRKKNVFIAIIALYLFIANSCDSLKVVDGQKGIINLKFNEVEYEEMKYEILTKSASLDLDTNNFFLSITGSDGDVIYFGTYDKKPEVIVVPSGSYDIKVFSNIFSRPAFDLPVFGDTKTIIVSAGASINVLLSCAQLNGGVKLSFSEEFIKKFPGKGLTIAHDMGNLDYSYNETKYAYFNPGQVSFIYKYGNLDTILFRRNIEAAKMLSFNLTYSSVIDEGSHSIKISIDTTRIWKSEEINVGQKKPSLAITLEQAREKIGYSGIPVFGYIVGGDVTTSGFNSKIPITSRTHIVIADSKSETLRENCFAVELPLGNIRDSLNLVDNPSLLGTPITITGEIVSSYYSYVGIKNVKKYEIIK